MCCSAGYCSAPCCAVYSSHRWNTLRWRHNDHAGVSNHQPYGCLLNRLFSRKSKKTSKLRVTGLCAGNSPGTGEFPAQIASYAENVSIWWRHHDSAISEIIVGSDTVAYQVETNPDVIWEQHMPNHYIQSYKFKLRDPDYVSVLLRY